MTVASSTLLQKAPAASSCQRAGILAGLAVISALLTTYLGSDPWKVLQIDWWDKDVPTPILPGLYFGLVLGAAIYLWTSRNAFNVFAVLIVTVVAWIAAHHTAVTIYRFHDDWAHDLQDQFAQHLNALIEQYRAMLPSSVPPGALPNAAAPPRIEYPYTFAVGGVLAGLVGSAITAFGVSIASADFRTVENWLRTLAIGTAAGVLLQWPELKITPDFSIILLYLIWQPAVAASIGYGLVRTAVRTQN